MSSDEEGLEERRREIEQRLIGVRDYLVWLEKKRDLVARIAVGIFLLILVVWFLRVH